MKRILVGALALLLSGCMYHEYIKYADYDGPPKASDRTIEVLDRGTIKRPYKVLGLATVEAAAFGVSANQVLDEIKQEAIQAGGDAVIDFGVDAPSSSLVNIGGNYQTVNKPRYQAKIIAWTN